MPINNDAGAWNWQNYVGNDGASNQGVSNTANNPFSNFNFGGAMLGSGLGGLLGNLFGDNKSPASAANPYFNQIPGAMQQYMNPYLQAGGASLSPLGQTSQSMMQDPGQFLNQMGQNFHQSPGFQFALQQAMMGNNNAMAAGGMAGSPEAARMAQQQATQLGNQDYYNWLGNASNMQGRGMQGMQGLAGMGMAGATNMSDMIAQELQNQAAQAYAGQAAQNQASSGMFGDIGAALGGLIHI